MIAFIGSGTYINCNRTCSTTASCDTCRDNPNRNPNRQTYIDVSTYPVNNSPEFQQLPKKLPFKSLPKFEKDRLKQNWKVTQDKHSRKR